MNKTVGKIVFFTSLAAIATGIVLLVKRLNEDDSEDGSSGKQNFDALVKNLGTGVSAKDGVVSIQFNNKQNLANFYNNNRIAVFKGKELLGKGTYMNGGKTINMDNGKSATGASIYTNLNTIVQ